VYYRRVRLFDFVFVCVFVSCTDNVLALNMIVGDKESFVHYCMGNNIAGI
jgi:hypothetical protein